MIRRYSEARARNVSVSASPPCGANTWAFPPLCHGTGVTTMRSFPISLLPLFTILTACSDYALTGISSEDNAATPSEPSEATDGAEPAVTEEDEEIDELETEPGTVPVEDAGTDEDLGSPGDCGFIISEGYGRYEETRSYAIFSIIGDDEIEIRPGEPATFQFAVTAHACGDIELQGLMITLSVTDYTPANWVTRVEDGEKSTMHNLSGDAEFESIDGYNCNEPGYDSQIFYDWNVEVTNPNTRGHMEEIYIEAGHTEMLEFTLIPTEGIEPGTQFELYLLDPKWIDIETGADVWDAYYHSPSREANLVGIRVTVVE